MVETKIVLKVTPHDLRIIDQALRTYLAQTEDMAKHPNDHVEIPLDGEQLEMFVSDAAMRASEVRAIINAIN